MKNIAIIGSTGSIGLQTLEVIKSLGSEYRVVALAAGSNDKILSEQVKEFHPELVVLDSKEAAARLAAKIKGCSCFIESGPEGMLAVATHPSADLIVMAQVGFSGFEPLIAALKKGKIIALANKESLVVGGEILKRQGLLDRNKILPVDSEHSAIWQCVGETKRSQIAKIFLTASGGPFYGKKKEELERVTPEDALKHPNWSMGSKITIDSASMVNKGLEVIEAKWLFDLELDQIEVLIHRQSIIHSMVEFVDSSVMAQLGTPDMKLPIQYALTYPERKSGPVQKYNPCGTTLTFEEPDRVNFPGLGLAYAAAKAGGTMPAVFNGANEVAVEAFLKKEISFTAIPEIISAVMEKHNLVIVKDIQEVIFADRWSRQEAKKNIFRA